jgi:hypothetical protein
MEGRTFRQFKVVIYHLLDKMRENEHHLTKIYPQVTSGDGAGKSTRQSNRWTVAPRLKS